MHQSRREFLKTAAVGVGVAGLAGMPLVARAQGPKLVVWWNDG